jgi:hypothetical protein
MEIYTIQKETRKHNKVKDNKTRKNLEIRRERERLARERFRERMNMPIVSSSVGFKGTKELDDQVEYLKKFFNL